MDSCGAFRDLVSFVQFKNTHGGVLFMQSFRTKIDPCPLINVVQFMGHCALMIKEKNIFPLSFLFLHKHKRISTGTSRFNVLAVITL